MSSDSGFVLGTMARDGACASAIRLTESSITAVELTLAIPAVFFDAMIWRFLLLL